MGCQDEALYFVAKDATKGDGARISHQSIDVLGKCREKRKRKKNKMYPLSHEPEAQPWQAQGSELLYVVSAGPGPANQNQLA